MRTRTHILSLIVASLVMVAALPAPAANKDMVQLQTQVQSLQDQVARLQQSMDMNMGAMRNLIEQSSDSVNKMNATVNDLQNRLQGINADNGGKIDQLSSQVQSLHDSVDELKSRLAKVSKQLDDMQQGGQNLNPGQPGMTAVPPGGMPANNGAPAPDANAAAAAPPPDVLYNNALRDYNSGKYDLASQEFAQYLQYYANTDLAGNAQYYLADIEYRQGNFAAAVKDYDKVLEQYPGGSKAAAAQLKKGYALLELGQREAGIRELNSLMARYPRSIEASQARDRLRRLGVTSSGSTVHRPPPASQQ
jgi:tol-pal system protein YbgF